MKKNVFCCLLILLIVMLITCGCGSTTVSPLPGSGASTSSSSSDAEETEQNTSAPSPTPEPTEEPAEEPASSPADEKNEGTLKITVISKNVTINGEELTYSTNEELITALTEYLSENLKDGTSVYFDGVKGNDDIVSLVEKLLTDEGISYEGANS